MLSNVDPYIGQMSQVKLLDLMNYLAYTTSSLTQEEIGTQDASVLQVLHRRNGVRDWSNNY